MDGISKYSKYEFKHFFKENYSSLVLFADSYVHDIHASQDLVQDCFIQFWDRRDDLSSINSLKSYMFTAVKNMSLNYLRSLRHIGSVELDLAQTLPDVSTEHERVYESEISVKIYNALKMVSERSRKILILQLEGLNDEEIATALSISKNTVHTLKVRAYKKLRNLLK